MDVLDGSQLVSGWVYAGRVFPGGSTPVPDLDPQTREIREILLPGRWVTQDRCKSNLTLYQWATIAAQLLRGSPDGKNWAVDTLYIEFENNGGAEVSVPSFDRKGGKSYFDALSSDPNRDYLRVPMTAATLKSTDTTLFPGGNQITFFAQTAGIAGIHGKTFSDSVSSRVYGAALVSTPDDDDASQDVVHSRFYYEGSSQLVKQAGSQISATWPLQLN